MVKHYNPLLTCLLLGFTSACNLPPTQLEPSPQPSATATPTGQPGEPESIQTLNDIDYLSPAPISPLFTNTDAQGNAFVSWLGQTQVAGIKNGKQQLIAPQSYTHLNIRRILMATDETTDSGLFLLHDGGDLTRLIGPNPMYTHALSINKNTLNASVFDLLSTQALSLDATGNGFALFSNERPDFKSAPNLERNIEHVSLLLAEVKSFKPAEPTLLFETPAKNANGHPMIHTAFLDGNSGFYVFLGADGGQYYLQAFQDKQTVTPPQPLAMKAQIQDPSLHISQQGNAVFWVEQDQLLIRRLQQQQLRPEVYTIPLATEHTTVLLSSAANQRYQLSNWDLSLDAEGNGYLASIQRGTGAAKDVLHISTLQNFKLKHTQAYQHPEDKRLVQVKLALNPQGQHQLFFIEGICSDPLTGCKLFEPDTLKIGRVQNISARLQP